MADYLTETVNKDFELVTVRTDWSPRRRSSRGGMYAAGPGINIALKPEYMCTLTQPSRFYEYPSFDENKVYGGFYYTKPLLKLYATVAHEVAHAIQFFEQTQAQQKVKPHGNEFKKHYADLRTTFVNPLIEEQSALTEQYNAVYNRIRSSVRVFT